MHGCEFLRTFKMTFDSQNLKKSQASKPETETQVVPLDATAAKPKAVPQKTAYNARTYGVYSNSLMPGESEQDVSATCEELYQEYEVSSLSGEVLVKQYVQVLLKIARLDRGLANKVSNCLSTRSCRKEFADQVGISPLIQDQLPDWWFELDPAQYKRAEICKKGLIQAKQLKVHHSPELMAQVPTQYPELVQIALGFGWRQNLQTFGEWLALRYKNQSPIFNIQLLIDEIKKGFEFELLWAKNEDRYKSVVQAVMAQAELNVRCDPNLQRAEAMLHKKARDLREQLSEYKRLQRLETDVLLVREVKSQKALT